MQHNFKYSYGPAAAHVYVLNKNDEIIHTMCYDYSYHCLDFKYADDAYDSINLQSGPTTTFIGTNEKREIFKTLLLKMMEYVKDFQIHDIQNELQVLHVIYGTL